MNTRIKATCEKLISNDTYSITHDLRDPVDPVESNSKCEQRDEITVALTTFNMGFPSVRVLSSKNLHYFKLHTKTYIQGGQH